ncbi:hypothetical protein P5V15_013884 [Pogonomyrmex californicus]
MRQRNTSTKSRGNDNSIKASNKNHSRIWNSRQNPDQGTNFTSELFKNTCKLLKIQKLQTTAYYPETNAALERSHRTLTEYLRHYIVAFAALFPVIAILGGALSERKNTVSGKTHSLLNQRYRNASGHREIWPSNLKKQSENDALPRADPLFKLLSIDIDYFLAAPNGIPHGRNTAPLFIKLSSRQFFLFQELPLGKDFWAPGDFLPYPGLLPQVTGRRYFQSQSLQKNLVLEILARFTLDSSS